MAEKKHAGSATPRKTTRSSRLENESATRSAGNTVSTAEPTTGTARNAVIEGNATLDLDDVRRRAYELYEERGGQHGRHEDDWYRAEQEVRNRTQIHSSIPPRKKSA